MSLLAIGECMIELGDRRSEADGDRWRMTYAGDSYNVAYAARAISGREVAYHTAHGDDPFSDAMRAAMRADGIGEARSAVLPGRRPGLYAISLDGAERSFTYWRADSAARHLADDPERLRNSLAGRDWVFVSGITLAIVRDRAALIAALREAAANGSRIAFDPNHRSALWNGDEARRLHAELLPHVGVVLTGVDDERLLHGRPMDIATIVATYARDGRTVIVKDGENGAWIAGPSAPVHVPPRTVEAKDTSGAGDAFDGGTLAGLMLGLPVGEAVDLGTRAAALTVCIHGARAPRERLAALGSGTRRHGAA